MWSTPANIFCRSYWVDLGTILAKMLNVKCNRKREGFFPITPFVCVFLQVSKKVADLILEKQPAYVKVG